MYFKTIKKNLCLLLGLAFIAPASFAGPNQLNITQAIDLFNYQIDTDVVSTQKAESTLKENVKNLLESGVTAREIQNTLVGALPASMQANFDAELEALKTQGASANEISDFTQRMALENQVTGVAFSGGPSVSSSSYGWIIGVIVIAAIAYAIDQENDDDDDNDNGEYTDDCDGYGSGHGYGSGYGYGGGYGNNNCNMIF